MARQNLDIHFGNTVALQEKAKVPSHLDLGCWEPSYPPSFLRAHLHMPRGILRTQSWGREKKSQRQFFLRGPEAHPSRDQGPAPTPAPSLMGKRRDPLPHSADEGNGAQSS
jgi:hypothetical protein